MRRGTAASYLDFLLLLWCCSEKLRKKFSRERVRWVCTFCWHLSYAALHSTCVLDWMDDLDCDQEGLCRFLLWIYKKKFIYTRAHINFIYNWIRKKGKSCDTGSAVPAVDV
jgi:hypothetical protein